MTLRVRKETLTELTAAELADVQGAGTLDSACFTHHQPVSLLECLTGHHTGR